MFGFSLNKSVRLFGLVLRGRLWSMIDRRGRERRAQHCAAWRRVSGRKRSMVEVPVSALIAIALVLCAVSFQRLHHRNLTGQFYGDIALQPSPARLVISLIPCH